MKNLHSIAFEHFPAFGDGFALRISSKTDPSQEDEYSVEIQAGSWMEIEPWHSISRNAPRKATLAPGDAEAIFGALVNARVAVMGQDYVVLDGVSNKLTVLAGSSISEFKWDGELPPVWIELEPAITRLVRIGTRMAVEAAQ
ncbi:hypothetical protein JCM19000A_23210 [Silvimonas sp. JCM 19000]